MYFNSKNGFFNSLLIIYLIRKIFIKLNIFSLVKIKSKINALIFFKSNNLRIGKNVTLNGLGASIKIGCDVNIYNNCVFEFGSNSHLLIGNHVIFSYGCVLCVNRSIKIGNYVQIGEYTSIRDSTHDYVDYFKPIMKNQDIADSISIGDNVWIGKNCLIFPGAVIEDGVVIGANSLVKGILKRNKIYGGNPIREIKARPH